MKNIDYKGIAAKAICFLVGLGCWTVLIIAPLHLTNII
jgi:hypothetical protein